jgi:hypothetical protein
MKTTEITAEQILAIRKAARAGGRTAEDVGAELGISAWSAQKIARAVGLSFKGKPGPSGPRGPNSEERNEAMRAGLARARARREGMEA